MVRFVLAELVGLVVRDGDALVALELLPDAHALVEAVGRAGHFLLGYSE